MFRHNKKKNLFFKIVPLFLIFFFIISFFSTTNKEKKTQVYQFLFSINQFFSIPLIYSDYRNIYSFIHNLKNIKIVNQFDKINIKLSKNNYNALVEEVNKLKKNALNGAILIKGKEPKRFKAKIKYKNYSIPATIELKGILISHIKYDNAWSLEIKLKKGHTINGFKNFSIQNFNERQFPYNAILNDIYKTKNFTTKDHFPIKISVNGLNWGLMYAEEEFSEVFFERRKIKNPYVFSIGDKKKHENTYLILKNQKKNISYDDVLDHINFDLNNFFKVKISGKNLKKNHTIDEYSLNEIKKNTYQIINLNSKFLPFNKFDTLEEDFIRLYGLSIIFCEDHAVADFNLNYYLNHYNHKIEIIPGDFSFSNYPNYKPYKFKTYQSYRNKKCDLDNLIKSFDYKFKNLIKKEENIQKIIDFIDVNYINLINLYNDMLHDYSQNFNFDYEYFKIKKIDNFKNKIFTKIKNINEGKNNNDNIKDIEFSIKNKIDYFYDDKNIYLVNLTRKNIELESIKTKDSLYPLKYDIENSDLNQLSISKLKISNNLKEKNISLNFKYSENKFSKKINLYKNYPINFKNYLKLENKNNFTFKKKNISVLDPIILPYGFNLKIKEGTQIRFSENSYILLLGGKINFQGSEKYPIMLTGLNDNLFWRGLHVIHKENDLSTISNTNFKNLNFHESKFNLTGGINFYKGKVNINNIFINNCISEDCLNIIKSEANLYNVSIIKTKSDAIDFDFSKGNLKNLYIQDVGGDALDFSGSQFLINDAKIIRANDKGISNGEASKLNLKSVKVSNSKIGIANKDGSYLSGENILSASNYLDIAAYQKKSFYKKSILKISDFIGESQNYVEEGHYVNINSYEIKSKNTVSKQEL